jgi:ABC-type lipoprotein release transport system permease subunit
VAFAGCAILLVAVAFLASYLPCRRVVRLDLATTLRQE